MIVLVTSSVMIPMTVAKVKVPTSHRTFIRCDVMALTSPITVTPEWSSTGHLLAPTSTCNTEIPPGVHHGSISTICMLPRLLITCNSQLRTRQSGCMFTFETEEDSLRDAFSRPCLLLPR